MSTLLSARPRGAPTPAHLRLVVSNPETWAEIAITWGETPLHLAHVRPGESFELRTEGTNGPRAFVVPETFGWSSAPLVVAEEGGFAITVPPHADARFTIGRRTLSRDRAMREGMLVHDRFALRPGRSVRFAQGGLAVEVKMVPEVEAAILAPSPFLSRRAQWAVLAVSAALHALVVFAILHLPAAH